MPAMHYSSSSQARHRHQRLGSERGETGATPITLGLAWNATTSASSTRRYRLLGRESIG
jgi:hypothetical protein